MSSSAVVNHRSVCFKPDFGCDSATAVATQTLSNIIVKVILQTGIIQCHKQSRTLALVL